MCGEPSRSWTSENCWRSSRIATIRSGCAQTLLRDVDSELMTREMSATLHERAADHLERSEDAPETVADHLERALCSGESWGRSSTPNPRSRTASALLRAGEERLERGDGVGAAPSWRETAPKPGRSVGRECRVAAPRTSPTAWPPGTRDRAAGRDRGPRCDRRRAARGRAHPLSRRSERLTRGRGLLERAVELGRDPNAAASLAGRGRGSTTCRRAKLYLRALERDRPTRTPSATCSSTRSRRAATGARWIRP